MAPNIRLARIKDAEQMLAIYSPYVQDTAISFEYVPPTLEEFQGRIENIQRQWPWLVCELDGRILGYAYGSQFRGRDGYRWAAEVSVYVHSDSHRGGIGRALYTSLLACLRAQGYRKVIAVIALPSPASVALHERIGFRKVGEINSVGYKHDAWHDEGFWQLDLQNPGPSPSAPKPISELVGTKAWNAALSKGSADPRA